MSAAQGPDTLKAPGGPTTLRFDDNALLARLFGEHDRNLARIEQQLGVVISSRGNELAISGAAEAVETARQVLSEMYTRLKGGTEVTSGDVDGAIRLARAGAGSPFVDLESLIIKTQRHPIRPRSPAQARYVRALQRSGLVVGVGPAGTGKTYLAVAMAVALLTTGEVARIILSRPAVEAGERLGFLPGEVKEKLDPYLRPLYDALHDMMPSERAVKKLETGEIEIAPLAFMRGRTLSNAFVILDEAQNTSPVQMKMFLTRLGENSRMAVTGDLSQVDLPTGAVSGLKDAIGVLAGVPGLEIVEFSDSDVVRNELVTRIVQAYDKAGRAGGQRR